MIGKGNGFDGIKKDGVLAEHRGTKGSPQLAIVTSHMCDRTLLTTLA